MTRRFLLPGAAAVLAAVVASGALLDSFVFERAAEEERARFFRDLDAAIALFATYPDPDPAGAAARISSLLSYQVTLMAPDGRVLADTRVREGDAQLLENHGARPEVRTAIEGERGISERRSATTGEATLYVARRGALGNRELIVRLARPSQEVGEARRRALWILAGAGLGGLLLLTLLAGTEKRRTAASVQALLDRVARIGEGELDDRPDPEAFSPELAPLAQALGRLGQELADRIGGLRRERDEMLLIVDSIAEGVVALTGDARVLRLNRAAAELLEVGGATDFAPVGSLVRHPELRDHLEDSVLRPLPPREFDLGGRRLLVSARHLPPGGAVVTFLDVTELRRMEKIRRDFVANASHELKTPLTAVRGFAEALLEEDPPEEIRAGFLSSIRRNTIRLQNLVDDLLDLSRLESGGWAFQEEEIEVAEAARAAWDELEGDLRERSLGFEVRGDGVALADAQALHQIFLNLFSNAIRYTPDGGSITVEIAEGPRLEVAVRDTGTGIPSASLPRIFERFYRVDPGRDRGLGGTGLGLAIVRHLVQSMGGEVRAASELGRGTSVQFTLSSVA